MSEYISLGEQREELYANSKEKNLFRRSLIEGRTVQLLLAFSVVYEVT